MTRASKFLLLILVGLLVPSFAHAQGRGVLLVERTTIGNDVRTSSIRIEPQRMRAEMAAAGSGQQVLIFDGAREVLWIVNDAERTYVEMTRADVERVSGQMNAMMAAMQEQLRNLPPAQRAQLEAMMRGRGMPGGGAPQVEFRRTGTDRVGSWTCTSYDGLVGGMKTMELCTVDPSVLGFTAADFAVSRRLAEFFGALMPQEAGAMFRIGADDAGFSGVPVRRVALGGRQPMTTELVEVSRQTFSDDLFAVPAGYTRQASPFGAPPQ